MSKVIVTYEDGRVWSCEVDAVGDGDAGKICAASVLVGIAGNALFFEPSVMPWKDGTWRSPTGIIDEWTNSSPGFVDMLGGRHAIRGGQAYSERGTVEESYAHKRYVLLNPGQLEGAISITVDGSLAYIREGDTLAPITANSESDGGAVETFGLDKRPEAIREISEAFFTQIDKPREFGAM